MPTCGKKKNPSPKPDAGAIHELPLRIGTLICADKPHSSAYKLFFLAYQSFRAALNGLPEAGHKGIVTWQR
jgi:hypothetical protein